MEKSIKLFIIHKTYKLDKTVTVKINEVSNQINHH